MVQQTDVVIIGAGLTGLTTAFHLINKGKNVRIVEKNDWTGGQIRTFNENGFLFESGPNTGSVSSPEVAELFSALFPACEMETADKSAKRRLVWKGERFRELPSGLLSGVFTPLFTLGDKFHILGEPFRKKGLNPDETVGEMAKRRLGKSFVDYAVDPFLSGIYAGDPMTLVTRYALPKLYNLEQTYGSFIKGSIAKARQPKTARDRLATREVFSVRGGLSRLISALTDAAGSKNIRLSASSVKICPAGNLWEVNYQTPAGNETVQAAKVITTTGAYALPDMLPFITEKDLAPIVCLRYAPVVQAAVGVKDTGGLRFNAFGGLVPSREKREVLGILFPSSCFRERAPGNGALFSFFIGGLKAVPLTQLSDEALTGLLIREFHAMLRFPADISPDMIRIFRHTHAIPQYEQNSGERFAAIDRIQNRYPGLILAGNIRNGISMADRILQATTVSKEILTGF
jgi:oxygen-dependent protoporphyrinogen oxidase